MRTTIFTFRYWDPSSTTQHSFDILVTTPLTEPPFTPKLDVIRMFTSPFTIIPSTAPVFDVLTTYLFESFTSIPPHFDSNGNPTHFTFRGAHFDTLFKSINHRYHRIGDTLAICMCAFGGPTFDPIIDFSKCFFIIEHNDFTPHIDVIYTEPPPLTLENRTVMINEWFDYRHFLSVPTVVPPSSFAFLTHPTTTDGLANWDFSYCHNAPGIRGSHIVDISALSDVDISNMTSMHYAFANCSSLTDISALSSWDISHVTDMSYMFEHCRSLTDLAALSSWNTSNVTNMNRTFACCNSIRNIDDISSWNTSNVTNMEGMFEKCDNLTDISCFAK